MNKPLLFILLTTFSGLFTQLQAQTTMFFQNFETTPTRSMPAGWTVASNTDVAIYNRLGLCGEDNRGVQTPGVGRTTPTGLVLPILSLPAGSSNTDLILSFKTYVFDANLACASQKDFPCPTFVQAYLVPTTWNDPLGTPTPGQYYATLPNYRLLIANANNTVIFNDVNLPAGVTQFRVLLNFKTATGSNCTSTGTKFVFDDFNIVRTNCLNCPPLASQDYFNADAQKLFEGGTNSFNGNVYGGYARWQSEVPTYPYHSLDYSPAVNSGLDYDLNPSELSQTRFSLISGLVVESFVTGCSNPQPGTLVFNTNGTFTYTRGSACVTRVSFTYTLTAPFGTTAPTKVIIDLPGQQIVLPVRLISFSAVRKENQVLLSWITAMEQDNKGFHVQRNSGTGWKEVSFVPSNGSNGNSTSGLNYNFTDLNPSKDISKYRILQEDLDGKVTYSDTKLVQGSAASGKLLVIPNPSNTGSVTLLFDSENAKTVRVLDAAGRQVQQYLNVTGNRLEVKNIRSGLYSVQIMEAITGTTTVKRFIIK